MTTHLRGRRHSLPLCLALLAACGWVWPTAALVCDRPWGDDVLAGARSALLGDIPARDDGFLIGRIAALGGPPDDRIVVQAAVVIDHEPAGEFELVVPAKTTPDLLEVGRDYFITLYRSTDPAVTELLVHPCGPVANLSSPAEARMLIEDVPGVTVVSQELLAHVGGGVTSDHDGVGPRDLALPSLIAISAAALTMVAFRRSRSARDP